MNQESTNSFLYCPILLHVADLLQGPDWASTATSAADADGAVLTVAERRSSVAATLGNSSFSALR